MSKHDRHRRLTSIDWTHAFSRPSDPRLQMGRYRKLKPFDEDGSGGRGRFEEKERRPAPEKSNPPPYRSNSRLPARKSPTRDQLKQASTKKIVNRFNGVCRACVPTRTLVKKGQGWWVKVEGWSEGLVLCKSCHARVTG